MPKHDTAARRRSKRAGRETGCWVYIPGEQLEKAGFTKADPPPWYRAWAGRKATLLVQLYSEP